MLWVKRGENGMTFWEAIKNQDYYENFITRSTYHSNSIEGNTLTYADTYAIIFNDNSFKISAQPREIYEAINHKYALSRMLESIERQELLSERMIIDIATWINKNIKDISGYRRVQVLIRGAEYNPIPPKEIKNAMMYYVYNYNHDEGRSIYEKVANYHIQFERIHPFEDGNGRTGRLLINFGLLSNGNAPIVIPKEERSKYFEYLSNQDIIGLSNFIETLSAKEQQNINQVCLSQAADQVIEESPLLDDMDLEL